MIKDLTREMTKFVNDMADNIKDPETLLYFKERVNDFFEVIVKEIEEIMKYKEDEIDELEKRQKEADKRLDEISATMKSIYKDIYDEGEDFEIICPYCNYEFDAEIDENRTEITCPECQNVIELDWNGNPDDDEQSGCGGSCSNCNGCDNEE